MASSGAKTDLRLVVLGRTGAGQRSTVCSILGLQDSEQGRESDGCSKHRGDAAGRQVLVVSSPDWFSLDYDPEERRSHISTLITFSSPGPHAFLLCVSVNQPADGETKALDVLEKVLGPSAVSRNTILIFTNMEELEEHERLEDYLLTWRKDLQALLERCNGRYHTLETRSGEPGALEEMLEKVEKAVKENGEEHFSCPLYQQVEDQLGKKQLEIVREWRKEARVVDLDVTDEEMEEAREEAERSLRDLNVDLDQVFPSSAVSNSSPHASSPLGFWETLVSWVLWLPTLVRREALLGALVGLFVGGPFGGVVGATVGSVATEVGRRKTHKTK
ncbi:GTPase IMAP family member 7 [Nerophis lumbriciformis]|uniref:GTPase IMAP family member 7 n=1 Tax=Nerophis lumbriciformis TaxID=546530 RepID=UPI002ADF72DE|nr:GTPase IMAP family member 7-like isoform X2 [Nerophis lumbriciformis]